MGKFSPDIPAPPPPPEPPAAAPTKVDASVRDARKRQQRRAATSQGQASTNLTGGNLGLATTVKTLLG